MKNRQRIGTRTTIGLLGLVLAAVWLVRWPFARPGSHGFPEPAAAPSTIPDPGSTLEAPLATPEPATPEPSRQAEGEDSTRTGSVHGAITVADGGTPKDFQVTLHGENGEHVNATAREDGYRASGLAPGTYCVSCFRRGWRSDVVMVRELRAGEDRRVDLAARKGIVLEVYARTPRGESLELHAAQTGVASTLGELAELVPVATLEPLGARFLWRQGGSGNPFGVGRFTPVGVSARGPDRPADPRLRPLQASQTTPGLLGQLMLEVDPPVYVALTCCQSVLASQIVPAGVEQVSFVLGSDALDACLAGLRFRFVDERGAPLGSPPTPTLHGPGTFNIPLPPSGGDEWRGLPPGEYQLSWLQGGLLRSFVLTAGETLDLGPLALGTTHTLRGRVRLADGTPPSFSAGGDDEPWIVFGIVDQVSGSIRIDDSNRIGAGENDQLEVALTPGLYTLQWISAGYASRPFVADLRAGDARAEITLFERAPLVLVPPPGEPELFFRIRAVDGVELQRGRFPGPWPLRLMLPAGPLRIQGVDPSGTTRCERFVDLARAGARVELGP